MLHNDQIRNSYILSGLALLGSLDLTWFWIDFTVEYVLKFVFLSPTYLTCLRTIAVAQVLVYNIDSLAKRSYEKTVKIFFHGNFGSLKQ